MTARNGRPSWRSINPVAAGRRIRQARLDAGLSQRQLAFDGCSAAYISRLEAGDRTPSGHLLDELARRLGTSARWLAEGVPELDPSVLREQVMSLHDGAAALQRLARLVMGGPVEDELPVERLRARVGPEVLAADYERSAEVLAAWAAELEARPDYSEL